MTDADAAEAQMAPVFAFARKIFGREPCTNEDCLCRSHDSRFPDLCRGERGRASRCTPCRGAIPRRFRERQDAWCRGDGLQRRRRARSPQRGAAASARRNLRRQRPDRRRQFLALPAWARGLKAAQPTDRWWQSQPLNAQRATEKNLAVREFMDCDWLLDASTPACLVEQFTWE